MKWTVRQAFQKWNEPVSEFMAVVECRTTEKRELEHDRIELRAEQVHRFQELCEIEFAVQQHFFVRDDLRDFY